MQYQYNCNRAIKIIQVMLVLSIDVMHSISNIFLIILDDGEDIITLVIPPSIIVLICVIFIVI